MFGHMVEKNFFPKRPAFGSLAELPPNCPTPNEPAPERPDCAQITRPRSAFSKMDNSTLFAALRLQAIFDIVLALAVGEAFRQFVFDKPTTDNTPVVRSMHLDRLPALIALVLLIAPFYQGIGQYIHEVYKIGNHPKPYGAFLLIDCGVFLLESILFFVMSRRLSLIDSASFYGSVLILLLVDTGWGVFLWSTHYQAVVSWLVLNLISIPVFFLLWFFSQKPSFSKLTPFVGVCAVAVRTGVDYWTSWDFYFPR
jgi:hypothetical protein